MWEVEGTDEFASWYDELTDTESEAVDKAVEALQLGGPALRRPYVGTITSSRHANMKELISPGGYLRILFAFDPRRTAILLLGGDKTYRWEDWYREMVPIADDLYDAYLAELKREGAI